MKIYVILKKVNKKNYTTTTIKQEKLAVLFKVLLNIPLVISKEQPIFVSFPKTFPAVIIQ